MAEVAKAPAKPRAAGRTAGTSITGPLFYPDLVRLARRGRSTLLRCTYAVALFAALYYAYHLRFPQHDLLAAPFASPQSLRVADMAGLAAEFVRAILVIQTAAIFVLTPAYLAGAIAEEREKRTLELLFTTHVSDREIVLGKLLARAAHLGGVLLAGLPLLAITQLWGGVDFRLLVAAYAAAGFNLLSVGAVCALCSVQSRSVTAGMFASYFATAMMLIPCFGLAGTPIGVFDALTARAQRGTWAGASPSMPPFPPPTPPAPLDGLDVLIGLMPSAGMNGIAFLGAVSLAVLSLRPFEGMPEAGAAGRSGPAPRPVPRVEGWGPYDHAPRTVLTQFSRPPVGDWPLLWKEMYSADGTSLTPEIERSLLKKWRTAALMFLLLGPVCLALRWRAPEASKGLIYLGGLLLRVAVVTSACAWCVVLGFRAAAGVCRERDGRTLEGLLMLPESRWTVLGAKWLGPVLYGRGFGYLLAVSVLAGLLGGVLHPLGALLLTAAMAAHVAFVASTGVWLSVASRNTMWARVSMALVLLAFVGAGLRGMNTDARPGEHPQSYAPVKVLPAHTPGYRPTPFVLQPAEPVPWGRLVAEVGANAPGAWCYLAFSWEEFNAALTSDDGGFTARVGVAACGILAYGALAGLFWLAAWWRFRREGWV